MSTKISLMTSLAARRALWSSGLVAFALVSSALLAGLASAIGQPSLGFSEATAGEQFQVMGPDWTVRTDLTFLSTETVRVNVTSMLVDWTGNAGGAGARSLFVQRYDGSVTLTATFIQVAGGPPFVYTTSMALAPLALTPDWYYVRILIDDTTRTFEAISAIRVGSPGVHLIETYTDDTFGHPSDVFTTTSVMWVRVIGNPDEGGDRWDIVEFVDGASAIGGAQGGFDNFRRVGDTYTFSIDLGQFPAAFASGWSYTLAVRLTGGAFDAGKQIQIFDPVLRIASTDLAPATARQGQTDVPMMALSLSLNPSWDTILGPGAFNLERVRVTLTGSGTSADVAGVHLWEDRNGNAVLDVGDVRIASVRNLGGVGFPLWLGTNGVGMTTVESSGPRHLLLTYDISPTANVGRTVGARIQAVGDIDLAGRFLSITGLPAQSGNVQILAAPVVTVTNDPAIAPAAAARGQTDVAMDLLDMSTNGAVITVHNISVNLAGTGSSMDIATASLHVDDGDGAFQSATDPIIGAPMAFPPSGTAVFRNLNLQVDAVGRSVWIVYDIAPAATVGADVGSRLPSNASVEVSGGSVFNGTFPLASGLTTIRGSTLTVTPTNLAPAQARQGRTNVPMLRLDLSVDSGTATVNGIRIDKRGSSALDSDVPLAKLWLDDGDGVFDLGDTLLGQQAFVGGTTVIGGFNLVIPTGAARSAFVTFDISPTATLARTVSARLADPAYLSADPDTTVDGASFPIASSPTLIVAGGPGAFVSVASVDLAASTPQVFRGQADVGMLKLVLSADANQATLTGMRVDKRGTSTLDSDVAAVKLYRDLDGNGNFTTADTLLGTTTFVADVAIFGSLNVVIAAGQPVTLFIVIDIAGGASVGQTVGVRLANNNYLAVDADSTVDPTPFPVRSSDVTILAQPLGTISGTVTDGSGNPIANATVEIRQLGLTTTTNAQGAYVFANVPMGTYYVIARHPGYVDGNQSVTLTTANPAKVVNFTLSPISPAGVGSTLLYIGVGLAALLVLAGLLFLFVRRKDKCPVCGKPKPRDREVCGECEAKGLRPPQAPPPPPSA